MCGNTWHLVHVPRALNAAASLISIEWQVLQVCRGWAGRAPEISVLSKCLRAPVLLKPVPDGMGEIEIGWH